MATITAYAKCEITNSSNQERIDQREPQPEQVSSEGNNNNTPRPGQARRSACPGPLGRTSAQARAEISPESYSTEEMVGREDPFPGQTTRGVTPGAPRITSGHKGPYSKSCRPKSQPNLHTSPKMSYQSVEKVILSCEWSEFINSASPNLGIFGYACDSAPWSGKFHLALADEALLQRNVNGGLPEVPLVSS